MHVYSFGSYAARLSKTGQSFSEEFQVCRSIYLYMYVYVCVYVCMCVSLVSTCIYICI